MNTKRCSGPNWSIGLAKVTIESAKKEIKELIPHPGEYGHNIVSALLRIIAKEYGYGEANRLVDELDLGKHFAIPKWWPAIDLLKGKDISKWDGPTAVKYNYYPTKEYGTKSI